MIKFDLSKNFIGSFKEAQLLISSAFLEGEDLEVSISNIDLGGGAGIFNLNEGYLQALKDGARGSSLEEVVDKVKPGLLIIVEGLVLQHLSDEERMAVLAHEYGHYVNGDMGPPKSIEEAIRVEVAADSYAANLVGKEVARKAFEKVFKINARFKRLGVVELDMSEDISDYVVFVKRLEALM